MGTTNQMLAYMMQNPNQPMSGGQTDMSIPDPQNQMPSSEGSNPMSMMGLSPQMLMQLYQSGRMGANSMSGGYGAGGNGLTQYAPYSQGIGPQDSAVISNMFASA